jgi:hypothetical protein
MARRVTPMDLPVRQRGVALLLLLAIVGMATLFALVAGLSKSAGDLARARERKTYAALAQAKAALIAYAVTYKDTHDKPGSSYTVPGYLPCPDLGSPLFDEGTAAGSCGASLVSAIGRLPWRTLGLDALEDGSGECLWYAVSGNYKNNPNRVSGNVTISNMMNWDTDGQFTVVDGKGNMLAGSSPDDRAVAVIFAPGGALSGQDRSSVAGTGYCGGHYSAGDYLESANGIDNGAVSRTAGAPSTFIAGAASDTFNDKLVYITRADIWNAIKKRSDFNNHLRAMTRRAAECIAMYGSRNSKRSDRRLPWASSVLLSSTSAHAYAVNARHDDTAGRGYGRVPYNVDDSDSRTDNDIPADISEYGKSGAYLFTDSSYCSYTPEQKVWYENWKDQLFYAVARDFRPDASWWQRGNCPTCLSVNGSGNYAAVVIFAGEKLTDATGRVTQPRTLAADKGSVANYLEGRNAANYPDSEGDGDYQAAAAGTGFNDIVYAIDSDLSILCSDAAGVMKPAPAVAAAPPGNPADYAACL